MRFQHFNKIGCYFITHGINANKFFRIKPWLQDKILLKASLYKYIINECKRHIWILCFIIKSIFNEISSKLVSYNLKVMLKSLELSMWLLNKKYMMLAYSKLRSFASIQ